MAARDIADIGMPDFTLEDVYDEWRASSVDLAADAVVAEASDGEIGGYAILRDRGSLAVVAPAFEGRGIGARLLAWTQQRERERGRARHRQWIPTSNVRAQALLRGAGYLPTRSYWRMA